MEERKENLLPERQAISRALLWRWLTVVPSFDVGRRLHHPSQSALFLESSGGLAGGVVELLLADQLNPTGTLEGVVVRVAWPNQRVAFDKINCRLKDDYPQATFQRP